MNPKLIASGAEDGSFKVFDLRYPKEEPITYIHWHEDQITSIEWQPNDQWTLAVSSADNRLSIWDFSVEDQGDMLSDQNIPEQIIFLH
jgi:ribosome assembly protein RRB1